jgi:hypothetical protein
MLACLAAAAKKITDFRASSFFQKTSDRRLASDGYGTPIHAGRLRVEAAA